MHNKLRMPAKDDALPGRQEPMPVPEQHFVNGARLQPPFPDGLERAVFGLGCFWGAERKFWQLPGVYTTAVGYAAGLHAESDLPRGLQRHDRAQRSRARRVRSEEGVVRHLLKTFWESHDPTQGMRQGNDVGTQYRSGIYYFDDAQREAAERSREAYQEQLTKRRLRPHHDRDHAGAGVLLRRGLPPAVPGEEPGGYCGLGGTGVSCPVGLEVH